MPFWILARSGGDIPQRLRVGSDPAVWGPLASLLQSQADSQGANGPAACVLPHGGQQGWWPAPLPTPDRVLLVRRLLLQVRAVFPAEPDLCLALVDLDARGAGGVKAARKTCRSLLKEPVNRNNLLLFARFARLEAEAGRTEDARKVYHTALDLSSALPTAQRRHAATLALQWAHLEVAQGRAALAAAILVAFATGAAPPPPAAAATDITPTLRARGNRAFEQLLHERMEDRAAEALPDLVACTALFAYLTAGLDAGCAVYDRVLAWAAEQPPLPGGVVATEDAYVFHRHSLGHEQVYCAYVAMVQEHASSRRSRSAVPLPTQHLRALSLRALEDFPANPEFLAVFLAGEVRCHIDGRVRA